MTNTNKDIFRENNQISIIGEIHHRDTHFLLSQLYQAIEDKEYKMICLNFEKCLKISSLVMLNLISYVMKYQLENVDFKLVLPVADNLKRLFFNSNWAHLISPDAYGASIFKGFKQVPATQYKTSKEQTEIVNKIVDSLICSFSDLDRQAFSAVEWAINEIMDNVLTHSESPIGGVIQLTTYEKINKKIEIIVTDAGLTIPRTLLDKRNPARDTPIKTLNAAIKEGVTNGKGQGNGLYGVYKICNESNGLFIVDSGEAVLINKPERDGEHLLTVKSNSIPMMGTTVYAGINCNVNNLLEKALRFNNQIYYPIDYIENKYDLDDANHFLIKNETDSVGNRLSGNAIRIKLQNISRWLSRKIYIDFNNSLIPSSSFLDEFIVKLIIEETPEIFKQKYSIINISETIIRLLDRSYIQRTNKTILPLL